MLDSLRLENSQFIPNRRPNYCLCALAKGGRQTHVTCCVNVAKWLHLISIYDVGYINDKLSCG